MHGSIFILLKKYVVENYDTATCGNLLQSAGIGHTEYDAHPGYPDEEINAILGAAWYANGLPASALQEISVNISRQTW